MNINGQNITPSNLGTEEESNFLNEIDFAKIIGVLRKSILWIIIILVVSFSGAYLYLRYTSPIFQSESVLKLNVKKEADLLGFSNRENDQDLYTLSGEIELMKSNLLLDKVIKKMDLDVSYYSYGNIMDSERYKNAPFKVEYEIYNQDFYNRPIDVTLLNQNEFELAFEWNGEDFKEKYKVNETIRNDNFQFRLIPSEYFTPEVDSRKFYFIVNSEPALINYITSNMNAEVLNMYANTLKVSFKDPNKFKAHDLVSTIDSVYLRLTLAEKNRANKQKITFLDTLLNETEKKLETYEDYFESFIIRNKTRDVPADISKTVEKIEELNLEKKKLITQISILENLSAQMLDEKDTTMNIPLSEAFADKKLYDLIEEFNKLIAKKERITFSYRENTDAYRIKSKEMATVKSGILERIGDNRKFLRNELNDLNNRISSLESAFKTLPSKGTEYSKNERQYKVHESYYLTMMQKKAELGIEEAGTIPEFQVLSPASIPSSPIFPERIMVYGIGLGVGLFLSIALVAMRYLLHNTINNLKDVEKHTSASVLGVIPYYNKEKMVISRLIVDRNPKSAISEALRSIRTNMEFLVPNKKKKIISVTSTVSGEGKTFVSVNLGGVIALSQLKVILVDLDMRKPKINLAFGHENLEGMSTILIGKHAIDDCIRKTSLKNLDYISAGPTPPNPSELIISDEFDKTLAYLHTIYDVIILDTPPVGLVTDGVLVMRKADLPIYIIRADYSKRDFLKSLNRLIKENKFSKTSIILNSVHYSRNNYYDYGYGNGYYEDPLPPSRRFPKIRELLTVKK